MAQAAIHNGADAVYIGMPGFNARGRSADLTTIELKQLLDFCHSYAVKVYLAANILIFENELVKTIEILREFLPLGFDAIIVQDLGLMKLIKQISPKQRIHASTQVSISNFEAIKKLELLGVERVVLARENSLADIKQIKENTKIEIEVFVHGALCVAFSGQCFTSEVQGGRSANRGQCAQSCRLPYQIFVDGKPKPVRGQGYVVSPQDLCGLEQIEELIQLGVESFKVEGRLKSPNYVASTALAYSQKIIEILAEDKPNSNITANELQQVYSRGFFSGWLNGVAHQNLVNANYSANQGLPIGKVTSVQSNQVELKLFENAKINPSLNFGTAKINPKQLLGTTNICAGDGILIDNPKNESDDILSLHKNHQIGSQVFTVTQNKSQIMLTLDRKINLKKIQIGAIVFHNSNQNLNKKLEDSYHNTNSLKKLPLEISFEGKVGFPLTIKAQITPINQFLRQNEYCITMQSEDNLQQSKSISLSKDIIFKELNKLDRSQFKIESFVGEIPNKLYLSQKNIKKIRQKMVEELHQKLILPRKLPISVGKIPIKENDETPIMEKQSSGKTKYAIKRSGILKKTQLILLLRSPQQIKVLAKIKNLNSEKVDISQVILDFEFGKEYTDGISQIKSLGFEAGIATTRILKPKEYYNLKKIAAAKPDFVLIRNLGSLSFFQELDIPLLGDFSLNVTNSITSDFLFELGFNRLTASYDLNAQQVSDLLLANKKKDIEVTIHQYMPEFHMEHCVFAAFLSKGNSYKDCGTPCEKHNLSLHDPYGNIHTLKADMECRNTMYTTKPQAAFEFLTNWQSYGCSHFRIEALDETADTLFQKIKNYFLFFNGRLSANELSKHLQINEKYGLAKSNYDHKHKYKSLKK